MPMNSKVMKRIVFGVILIAATTALLWFDWWLGQAQICSSGGSTWKEFHPLASLPLLAVSCVLIVFAFREIRHLAHDAGVELLGFTGILGALALASSYYWFPIASQLLLDANVRMRDLASVQMLMMAVLFIAFFEQMICFRVEDALRRIGCTMLAVLYLGLGGLYILSIRKTYGVDMFVVFLVAVKFMDIGAYFTGTAIGRHKLIPWLSPGKSWEGLIGGLVVGAGATVGAVQLFALGGGGAPRLSIGQAAMFGAVVGLAGQFGDLCESLLKRAANAKDSGHLVPEFGGVLDILDSPLLAAPVAYVLLGFMP